MESKMLTLFVLLATVTGLVKAQQKTNGAAEKETVFCFSAKSNGAVFTGNDNTVNFVTTNPMIVEQSLSTEQSEQKLQSPLHDNTETTVMVSTSQNQISPFYLGFGGGLSFGRTTFASFAMDETHPGFNLGVLGGYKINKRLSAEISLDYTRMKLGTYDCCQNLWLGKDGNRYFAPLSGVTSYKYSDLTSTTNLVGLGTHLNIDLLSIWKESSKWSAFLSPAIYGVYSNVGVKQLDTKVRTASTLHFSTGIDLGVGYIINPKVSLRLTTGINYLTGAIDALPREEHKITYVWNSSLKLIYKL
jgi:hypothetical protein